MDIPVELIGSNKETTTLRFSVSIESGIAESYLKSQNYEMYTNIIQEEKFRPNLCKSKWFDIFLRAVP